MEPTPKASVPDGTVSSVPFNFRTRSARGGGGSGGVWPHLPTVTATSMGVHPSSAS